MLGGVVADQRRHEARAVAVAEVDGRVDVGGHDERRPPATAPTPTRGRARRRRSPWRTARRARRRPARRRTIVVNRVGGHGVARRRRRRAARRRRPAPAAAASTASRNTATRSRRPAGMQHTLSVLQTLRSSEWQHRGGEPAGVGRLAGDEPGATRAVQADRRAGLAGDRAELGDGGAGAAGDGEREAAVVEQRPSGGPRRRAHERHRHRPGSPAAASAGASAAATIASAVPSASEPMRITTVLPVRSTPVASAKTLGRPSNTNPTTPSGARRAATDQPAWSMRASSVSRRTPARRATTRSPATMSSRIRSDSTSRVVERPAAAAAATSASLAARIGASTSSSARRAGEAVEERRDLVVAARRQRGEGRHRARRRPAVAAACSAAGTCSRSPVSWTTSSRSPAGTRPPARPDTVVTRLPPNTIGWPACSATSSVTTCRRTPRSPDSSRAAA